LDHLDDSLIEILKEDFRASGIPDELLKKLFAFDYNRNIEGAIYIKEKIS
jgi:hypothetical protein